MDIQYSGPSRECDFVSLHAPLTPETRDLINAVSFGLTTAPA
jgi:phosphoglycerate dehydrogenase-like enzyme